MQRLLATAACNLDLPLLQAAFPLFESGEIAALEWSFDSLFKAPKTPDWFTELLNEFGKKGRLVGHGVFFSILSGKWTAEQEHWLDHLKELTTQFQFDHISEHFGFLTGADFHKGAPLGVPMTELTLALGRERLQRISQVCNCPVGLENLAFAWSIQAVREQGEFLDRLLEPVNGFVILDLHNLYCQLHNFEVEFSALMACYPLERVREIHISGGSWMPFENAPKGQVRRDTHDDAVPETVWEMLEEAIPQCPNLKFVVLEQMGTALYAQEEKAQYQNDFRKMAKIVNAIPLQLPLPNDFISLAPTVDLQGLSSPAFIAQQDTLSQILETSKDFQQARASLLKSPLAASNWQVEKWPDHMLETAVQIAQKWKRGFE